MPYKTKEARVAHWQYVRIELPGGYVRVVSEATYNTLVINLRSMARSLENSEFVSEPNGETRLALKGGIAWWRDLFVTVRPTSRKVR